MSNFKRLGIIAIISTLIPVMLIADGNRMNWNIGEKLIYSVSWGIFRLGTLELSIIDTTLIDSQMTYHAQLKLDSNPWLFFVNMHSVFDSYLMPDYFPLLFVCHEKIDGEEYNSKYAFDYENKIVQVHYEGVENPNHQFDKEVPLNKKLYDGISIIYYARNNCNHPNDEQISVIYEGAKEGLMDIIFTEKKDSIDVSISDNKLPAFYLFGKANFKAIAGFSGKFEGWFSQDIQHVPLKAKMVVFIGSVQIELESWKIRSISNGVIPTHKNDSP